jgi:hypothetical protein
MGQMSEKERVTFQMKKLKERIRPVYDESSGASTILQNALVYLLSEGIT